MGLDQYIYRVTKLTQEDISEIQKGNTSGFSTLDLDQPEDDELVEYIKDYVYIEDKTYNYYDPDKVKKFFNIPENASFVYSRSDNRSIVWLFRNRETEQEYRVTPSAVKNQSEVTVARTIKIVYLKEEEIGYWRKDYKLQEAMHVACDHAIKNCGYYPLNKEMMKILLKDRTNIFAKQDLVTTDQVAVCYLEWY